MSELLKYWPVALFLLQALSTWAAWSLLQLARNEVAAKTGKLSERDDEIAAKVNGQDLRIAGVESRMAEAIRDIEALPTKADLARVEGEVRGVASSVHAANEGIRRIEGYFIERGVRS